MIEFLAAPEWLEASFVIPSSMSALVQDPSGFGCILAQCALIESDEMDSNAFIL